MRTTGHVRRHAKLRRVALVLASGLLASCEPLRPPASVPSDTVEAVRVSRIGRLDGASDQVLGRVAGVALGPGGAVYVADAIGSTVRAYDAAGDLVGTVGVEGDGPGEFRALLGLDIDPSGRLVVRGAFRVSFFEPSAESAFADSVVRTLTGGTPNPDRDVRARAGHSGFYSPSFVWEGFQRRGYFYLVHDSTGTVTDTIGVPDFPDPESTGFANYPINERGGANVPGINRVPFEPRPSWDITRRGEVWLSQGERYEIVAVGPGGDTIAVVRRSVPPESVPPDERRDSAEAFQARLDSVPVPLDRVRGMSPMARRGELPATLPAIVSVHLDQRDRLWVRRWPRADTSETVFDVFDSSGAFLQTVRLPGSLLRTPPPWIDGETIVGVEQDPTTGVHSVGTFRLPSTPGS